ncbi:MAG TPA: 30S ribosomal protein S6 [Terriglobales bacterium]|nr:30S ribosomal protein S6 [Terriglobales bacterium]
MQRLYEVMFIVKPDVADEEVEKLIQGLESNVSGAGGVIKSIDRLGRRRLAYNVRGTREGNYVLFTLEGAGETIHELERRMRVSEPVLKFLTVRIDQEQKRLAKVKAIRATKVRRAAQPETEAPGEQAAVSV